MPETYSETIDKNSKQINLDAFIFETLDNQEKTVRVVSLDQFLVRKNLNIIICPQGN